MPQQAFAIGPALHIGPHPIRHPVLVAPMAGVTDRPYRKLCRSFGAAYTVSEMAASNPALWKSVKTAQRLNHEGEPGPVAVQLAGASPQMMAEAARFNADRGAQIIDLNMGCPAQKVCAVAAGSALMGQESLALSIVEAVIEALANRGNEVPVTVKMRTGIDTVNRNVRRLAVAMESVGVSMIVVHGRTRQQGFTGSAEYESVREVKDSLRIPVIANGDIDSIAKARAVMASTGCDGVMIGRAALGRPWLFAQIAGALTNGTSIADPGLPAIREAMKTHFEDHISFYGEASGLRSIRKHVAWYLPQWVAMSQCQQLDGMSSEQWTHRSLQQFFGIDSSSAQWQFLDHCLNVLVKACRLQPSSR